ncbi:ArnT family glycosyltransferase [Cytophaga aurantiaca]|uniref:ArnT family glycosyltransferase n=1 Tax=Cytophaga aurantiaca TaxID=29530 RepID=UPI0012F848CC|nr:glycosyltransferase family 39 protein [Cytophaga aurantiaca]
MLASVLLFPGRRSVSLFFLVICTFLVGLFVAMLDPFLIIWDEQFHALVAKNMVDQPFEPTLYKFPILEYDFKNWTANHTWLHKQPLFLWLISFSIKYLGNTALAVRMPSVIMHAIIPLFIYRIGSICINERVGYVGALFFAIAYFPLELSAGRYSTDHNDAAFLFFITGSIWSWFEYQKSKNMRWLICIAIFSGCAVLVKWLMGLLIYVVWAIVIFFSKEQRWKINSYIPLIIAFSISACIFLPWQIYIFLSFPKEAQYELLYNGKHFFEALEGHTESTFFYFTEGFEKIYGAGFITPFFYLAGFILLIVQVKEKRYKIALSTVVIIVYIFYSIAKTKMIAFPVIVSPIIFLGLGALIIAGIDWIETKISDKKIVYSIQCILILTTAFFVLDFSKIEKNHTIKYPKDNHQRDLSLKEMKFIQFIKKNIAEKNTVIFNTSIRPFGYVHVMFYTDFIAYSFVPSKEQIEKVKSKGYKIAVLDRNDLPPYILEDKTIKIVQFSF